MLHFDQLPELYNYVEVGLWPTLGVLCAIQGFRQTGIIRRDFILAAGILIVFGASDWFEANTGNEWWHPWWLLLWKAACVVALFVVIGRSYQRRRATLAS